MKAVITVTGKDKVGIIALSSSECAKYGANIIDISQTVMKEYFAMIMLVELSVVLEQKGLLNAADQADFEQAFTAAVREKFGKKPGAVESNAQAFAAGRQGLSK